MQTENNTVNSTFNNDDPAAQTVIVDGDKTKLPKLMIPRGERFYISLEELSEVNARYFNAVSDMREGTEHAQAELKSLMESGIELAYYEDIARIREKNRLEFEVEQERIEALNYILTPRTRRRWIFWKKPNDAKILLDELINRQAAAYLQHKADELPSYPGEEDGVEQQPFEVVIATLKESLPRMRKKRRASIEELIEQLVYGYGSKVDELKRLAVELKEAKEAVAALEERALHAEELLEEFLQESTPAPAETTEKPEQQETEEATAETPPEEEPAEQEAESNPADDDEDDGLSYDGLEEEDE